MSFGAFLSFIYYNIFHFQTICYFWEIDDQSNDGKEEKKCLSEKSWKRMFIVKYLNNKNTDQVQHKKQVKSQVTG